MERFKNKIIDKRIPTPLYYQLKKIILDMIESGELQPEDMIPTEMELSERFDISRTTIRQAIMELVSEGRLYRIKSKGTFVTQQEPENISGTSKWHEIFKTCGLGINVKVTSANITKADSFISKKMGIQKGKEIICLSWKSKIDEKNKILFFVCLPSECKSIFDLDFNNLNICEYIQNFTEEKPVKVLHHIEAKNASDKEAEELDVDEGDAILQVSSTIYTKNDKAIAYVVTRFENNGIDFSFQEAI